MATYLYAYGESQVAVRDPDVGQGYEIPRERVGSDERMLDGTHRQQVVAVKRMWRPRWTLLTAAEYATLIAELVRLVDMAWRGPEMASAVKVHVVAGELEVWVDQFGAYNVQATLVEV